MGAATEGWSGGATSPGPSWLRAPVGAASPGARARAAAPCPAGGSAGGGGASALVSAALAICLLAASFC
eukprot:3796794-Alexandrium_andersonii.AAC.1